MKRYIRDVTEEEQKKAKGNCYLRAFELMKKFDSVEREKAKLVHGKMVGITGDVKDIRFGHAWVEIEDMVYELPKGKRKIKVTKKDKYYEKYLVSDTKKYSYHEMYEIGHKYGGTYGPWE